jgi:hypothetical protein
VSRDFLLVGEGDNCAAVISPTPGRTARSLLVYPNIVPLFNVWMPCFEYLRLH